MSVNVLYFASIKDITKRSSDAVSLSDIKSHTIDGLLDYLLNKLYGDRQDQLKVRLRTCMISINCEMINVSVAQLLDKINTDHQIQNLKPNDEIAFIPPVSGG